jgi:hypothetical protein
MERVAALQRRAPSPAHKSKFTPVWRRWEQAADSYDEAEEAEDFQAVGVKCRETLIQLVRALTKPGVVPEGEEAPKRADVVGWSSLIANTIAPGDRNSYLRGHLKAISKSAWDLANWLTHANGATRPDAEIVLDATHSVIGTFGTAVMRHESGSPERCPECGSHSIDVGFEPELLPRPCILECENCGWQKQQQEESPGLVALPDLSCFPCFTKNAESLSTSLSEDGDAHARHKLLDAISEQKTTGTPLVRKYTFDHLTPTDIIRCPRRRRAGSYKTQHRIKSGPLTDSCTEPIFQSKNQ